MREGDGVTGVDPQKIEVRKYGHTVPLADGTCQNCGGATKFNLAVGIVAHVDGIGSGRIVCRDPWPALSIERPEIDVEALTGIGVSAFTQEAPQRASGDRGARVDGSGADDSLPDEPPVLSVVLMRAPRMHPAGTVYRRYGGPPGSQRQGWCQPGADLTAKPVTWAQLHKLGEVTLLVESWRPAVPADGLVKVGWHHANADAGTAEFDRLWADLENAPAPPAGRVEWGAAHGTCEHWGSWLTEDALTTWLVDNPDWRPIQRTVSVVTPLPPASDETREHPGTGQPTEGVPGEESSRG